MGKFNAITIKSKPVTMYFPFLKQLNFHTQEIRIYQQVCRQKAEPTQHKYSATTAAKAVTGDRAEKLQEDTAVLTRHSAVIAKRSTDSVSSKGSKLF